MQSCRKTRLAQDWVNGEEGLGTVRRGLERFGTVRRGLEWFGTVRRGLELFGTVRRGLELFKYLGLENLNFCNSDCGDRKGVFSVDRPNLTSLL